MGDKREFQRMFTQCQEVWSAIGDPTRQIILRYLMEHCGEGGKRVGEIQQHTNLSRTAVSHHVKILKDAEILTMRRVSTRNYYDIDPKSSSIQNVIQFWKEAEKIMDEKMPGGLK